ncbi:MAG: TadE/TadG family type IV pilus assembly protein [Candidatus Binatia bacterium]
MMQSLRARLRSQKGQSLIELSLIAPLMIFLAYGAIEVGQVISTHLTMTHTSREGANLVSRGTTASNALDAIIASASDTFKTSNQANWKIIYSKVTQDITVPCPNPPTTPCTYRIESQLTRGLLVKNSKLSSTGAVNEIVTIPGIGSVIAGQTFQVIEVYFNYLPYIVTYVGKGINTDFYDRTIFTNVSGSV